MKVKTLISMLQKLVNQEEGSQEMQVALSTDTKHIFMLACACGLTIKDANNKDVQILALTSLTYDELIEANLLDKDSTPLISRSFEAMGEKG